MNKVELLGRLTRNPEMKNVGGSGDTPMARYTLAVDRRYRAAGADADFIPCVVFGKGAEFAMKYLKKGSQIVVCGRITSGSYTDGDGKKVYSMNVVVDEHYFAGGRTESSKEANVDCEGFMSVSEGEELPFE